MTNSYLILSGILHLSVVIQPVKIQQDAGVRTAAIGQNVTLRCVCNTDVSMHVSWYRQPVGGPPELLSSLYIFDDPSKNLHQLEKDPRFSVWRKGSINNLHISKVHPSDSATYYCGSSHVNLVEFGEGVFLNVEGSAYLEVVQKPASETVQPGGSVTFTCTVHSGTCVDGLGVYWFRHGSHQGVLHAHGNQCEPVSGAGPPSRRCIYHLQKENVSSSDAGMYYCAVAACGEILFGSGSMLFFRDDPEAQIRFLAYLAIVRTVVVLLLLVVCLFVYVNKKS